jgi:hypothetical protein
VVQVVAVVTLPQVLVAAVEQVAIALALPNLLPLVLLTQSPLALEVVVVRVTQEEVLVLILYLTQ